jgi:hypothetical protein
MEIAMNLVKDVKTDVWTVSTATSLLTLDLDKLLILKPLNLKPLNLKTLNLKPTITMVTLVVVNAMIPGATRTATLITVMTVIRVMPLSAWSLELNADKDALTASIATSESETSHVQITTIMVIKITTKTKVTIVIMNAMKDGATITAILPPVNIV